MYLLSRYKKTLSLQRQNKISSLVSIQTSIAEEFSFGGKKVRSYSVEDKTYLIAKDVCFAIGYNDNTFRNALDKHVPDKYKVRFSDIKGSVKMTRPSNAQPEQILLTEPGLYCILLRSKKDDAEPFMDWVVKTVLPREVRNLAKQLTDKNKQIEEKETALQERDNQIQAIQYENVGLQGEIRAKNQQIDHLMTRYVEYARDPGKDNVVINHPKAFYSERR